MLKRRKAPKMNLKEPTIIKSEGHKKFVRGFMCAVANRGDDCFGKMHAHHVTTRGAGGGDEQVVPLCAKHHDEIHTRGQNTFAAAYKVDLEKLAKQLWKASSHRIKYEKEHLPTEDI